MNSSVTSVSGAAPSRPRLAIGFAIYCVVFGAIWVVLTNGDTSSWMFGIPFTAFAALVSSAMSPITRLPIRPLALIRFLAYFLRNSVVGGVDVALRALQPSMPLTPGIVVCSLRLPTPTTRALLAYTVSLLPGTLSSGLEDEVIALHVLDTEQPVLVEIRRIENLIADIMGIELLELPAVPSVEKTSQDGDLNA